jgi:dTDP-4-amino-4,6-dideoxygalactose transaminase
MSLEDLERKINVNTRIITVVHWGGNPIDMDKLEAIVKNAENLYGRPIAIIEDCAHSFGGKYPDGRPIGFRGNFATFSLQAIKHITSGDGGFFVTPFDSIEQEAKLLRWYGIDREGPRADFRCEADVPEAGFKFHMNDISAAIGRCNLAEANYITSANQSNGTFYNTNLNQTEGITLIPEVGQSAYWLYSFHAERRDDLMKYLGEHGVASSRVHERNDKHSCMLPYWSKLPGVDQAVKTMLSLPVGYWVTEEDREYIVDLIKKGW